MPIYEYECEKCGTVEEVMQKFSEKPLKKCRHCSGKLHKLISQSSFHLKGSGWYVTDYAAKKSARSTRSKKSEDADASPPKKEKTSTPDSTTSS